jgi:hypothetical protein
MGTGTAGGAGSGAGRGGGGGRTSRFGSYRFTGTSAVETTPSEEVLQQEISTLLRGRAISDYLKKQFGSPLTTAVYQRLMDIADARDAEDPFGHLTSESPIDPGPGFLMRLAAAITAGNAGLEPDRRVRETMRICVEDFLLLATGDDPDVYISGTRREALERLDRPLLGSTLGYFLGSLITHVVEREAAESLPSAVKTRLRDDARRRGDRAIESFKERFIDKRGLRYRDFFDVVRDQPAWFINEIAR